MMVKALIIALMGYLGSGTSSQNQELHNTEIVMYVRPGVIQAQPGAKTLSLESVTMPEEMREILEDYNAEYLVRPYPDYDSSDTIAYSPEGKPVKKMDLSRLYRVHFPDGTELDSVVAELNETEGVIFAERIPVIQLMAIPNDEFFQYQWGLNNTGQAGGTAGEDIHAVEAWDIFTGSSSVKIGIIDAGIKRDHEDLNGKVVSGDNSYSDSHGTHVAGIAAAMANNTIGIAGVDWHAKIDARDLDGFSPSLIYDKIVASVDVGSDVLNNSWGGSEYSATIRWAFHYAYEMDRVPVAAMGNDGAQRVNYPAAFPVVLAVGATTNNGHRSYFSTYGNHIDVVAPGGINPFPYNDEHDILSTWTNNDFQDRPYRYLAGTSMAAPFVTGLAALLKGFNPDLTNDDIMWVIRISADDKGGSGWDSLYGYGRINAERALKYAQLPYKVEHFTVTGGTDYSSTDWYGMWFPMRDLEPNQAGWKVKRHEVRRTVYLPNSDYIEKWVWGRKESTGWSKGDPTSPPYQWEEGWCEPVSIQGNTVVLRTYVYEVQKVDRAGRTYGDIQWWPTTPENVVFAFTLLSRKPIYTPTNL